MAQPVVVALVCSTLVFIHFGLFPQIYKYIIQLKTTDKHPHTQCFMDQLT